MVRCIVNVVLVLGLLATQWVRLCHAHDDHTPHVHFGKSVDPHPHHEHRHPHDHDHTALADDTHAVLSPVDDHDGDAVYLPSSDWSAGSSRAASLDFPVYVLLVRSEFVTPFTVAFVELDACADPPWANSRPRYLLHLTLVI